MIKIFNKIKDYIKRRFEPKYLWKTYTKLKIHLYLNDGTERDIETLYIRNPYVDIFSLIKYEVFEGSGDIMYIEDGSHMILKDSIKELSYDVIDEFHIKIKDYYISEFIKHAYDQYRSLQGCISHLEKYVKIEEIKTLEKVGE